MVDGLNFKDFVSFLSTFSARASLHQKIECNACHVWISILDIYRQNEYLLVMDSLVLMINHLLVLIWFFVSWTVIFKVYDIDGKGKVTFKDLVEVLRDLTGSSMSEQQREVLISYKPVLHCIVHSFARCGRFFICSQINWHPSIINPSSEHNSFSEGVHTTKL